MSALYARASGSGIPSNRSRARDVVLELPVVVVEVARTWRGGGHPEDGEIDKMGDKLRDHKNFLADVDRRNDTIQEWVGQLKRAMYEATDILDLCQLKAMGRASSTALDARCFNPLLFCMRNPSHAHEIGTRIKTLNKKLDYIKERSAAFNFVNLGSYADHNNNAHGFRHCNTSRETVGDFDRSAIVGDKIEQDTRALVAQIMRTGMDVNNGIMVVAIVGVGGIVKTTLVQKVLNDKAIQGSRILVTTRDEVVARGVKAGRTTMSTY
ncbi:disease resistance RPP13-like protein 4 [Triticum aestivum]|uniref:disease resistance RPP13-like protein 4 n=1 Tax=Triticum aestivum TaxID=4565 RepID=UPI001D006ACD|nr:disease resistance RPP13-like protein 4 [Triticum aestivum]